MSWTAADYLRPAADMLMAANAAQPRSVMAGQYAFAALMHASTRGADVTPHGKLLNEQYALTEPQMERATRIFADTMQAHPDKMSEFTSWFNEEIMANPEHDDHAGRTMGYRLLREAVENGDVHAVRELLEAGSDPNAIGMDGAVMLEGATHIGNAKIVKLLLQFGARAEAPNPHGSTAVHTAAYFGKPKLLRLLVDALAPGTTVDLADENGNTPLVAASARTSPAREADRLKCVNILLAAGADAEKAFNTAAHPSVVGRLGTAATGKPVSSRAVANADAIAEQESREVVARWNEAFQTAVDMGVLSTAARGEQSDALARAQNGALRVQRMEEQLRALTMCELDEMLRKGTGVCLTGLVAKPHLNGTCGRVREYVPSKGRYVIQLEGADGEPSSTITVKLANLEHAKIVEDEEYRSSGRTMEAPADVAVPTVAAAASKAAEAVVAKAAEAKVAASKAAEAVVAKVAEATGETHVCAGCGEAQPKSSFSKAQWKKHVKKCKKCAADAAAANGGSAVTAENAGQTAPQPSPAPQPTSESLVGEYARITSLVSRTHLNGAYVDIKAYDTTTGRYKCMVKGSGEWVALQRESLTVTPRTDADGIAMGAASCTVATGNVIQADTLAAMDPDAYRRATAKDPREAADPADDGPPILDGQLEPRDVYRKAVRLTEAGEYAEACWNFMLALLIDWALNASDLNAAPRKAVENSPPDEPAAIAMRAVVEVYGDKGAKKNLEQHLAPLKRAAATLIKSYGKLGPQNPPPTTLAELHRGRLAACAAHLFLGRVEQHSGPYTPAYWAQARRTIQKGIALVDAQRLLCMQYELAYTARDAADTNEALKWYDTMLRNAPRVRQPSPHWVAFLERVGREARTLRFEAESGINERFRD